MPTSQRTLLVSAIRSVNSMPSTTIRPPSCFSTWLMHRINVDLPEPVTSIRYSLLTIRPFAFNADVTRLTGAPSSIEGRSAVRTLAGCSVFPDEQPALPRCATARGSADTSKRDGLAKKQPGASTTVIPSTSELASGPSKYRGLQPRRTIAPDQPRLGLPVVHETTHRHSPKSPIAVRHAIEMHLSEQGGEMFGIMRDDNPEMQILHSSPVHQMTYLKRIHRRAGLTAISFRYGKPRHQRNAIRAKKGVT
jgi:hypothetical protein